jgi:hypothetical protein
VKDVLKSAWMSYLNLVLRNSRFVDTCTLHHVKLKETYKIDTVWLHLESQKCFKELVSLAGGGLISGIALAAKAIKPEIIIIAAEPSGADDAAQSKAAGRIVTLKQPKTIADGLRASLGNFTWYHYRIYSVLLSLIQAYS